MRAASLCTISSVTGSHSAAPGSRKVTVCENEPEGRRWCEVVWGGFYIKRGAESRGARCHVKTLLMKRRQMSAVLSRSARRVGLKGGIVNTEGAHAIVMTFFPPLHNPPHPPPPKRLVIRGTRSELRRRPGMASSPRLSTRISGLLIEWPRSHKNQMGADKWSFRLPPGFYGESTARREASNRNCLSSTVLV